MASIHSKDTKPELMVFAYLRAKKITFRAHYERAVGKPDIAKPRKKLAVFIDGDFWHGRELERVIRQRGEDSPWVAKLKRNIARDVEQTDALTNSGWAVLRIWESDLSRARSRDETLRRVAEFLRSRDESDQ